MFGNVPEEQKWSLYVDLKVASSKNYGKGDTSKDLECRRREKQDRL